MSILAERGQIGPAPVVPAQPHRPIRVVRGRRGEVQRPPTRRRLVAGRRAAWSAGAPCATPRRPATRWPWLLAVVGTDPWLKHWPEVGVEANKIYNYDERWIKLSRDLHGIPRRILHDFNVPDEKRDTPLTKSLAWGLWGFVLGTTVVVYLARGNRRHPTGQPSSGVPRRLAHSLSEFYARPLYVVVTPL